MPQPRQSCLYVNRCLPATVRTLHNNASAPTLLGLKGHLDLVLDVPPYFLTLGGVAHFLESVIARLEPYIYHDIACNFTIWRRF